MIGLGVLLLVLGFGSAILYLAGSPITFALMALLDPLQPWVGFVVGLIGAALLWFGWQEKKKAGTPADPGARPDAYGTPGSGTTTGFPGTDAYRTPAPNPGPQANPAPRSEPAPQPNPAPPSRPAGDGTPGSGTNTGF